MPTVTLYPRAVGCNSAWTVGAGSRPTCVATNDGDGSYIFTNTSARIDSYILDLLPAAAVTVSQVDVHFVGRYGSGAPAPTIAVYQALTGCATSNEGASQTMGAGYADYVATNTTRPGGGAWSVADVNGASFGVKYTGLTGDGQGLVTQIYANVTYATAAPTAPSGLIATVISAAEIDLSWTDNSTDETGFKIYRCSGGGCTPSVLLTTTAAGVVTYADTGLAGGTTYNYFVKATNASGDSAASNTVSATTLVGDTILLMI